MRSLMLPMRGWSMVVVFPADTTVWRQGIFQSRRVGHVLASSTGAFDMAFLAPGDYYLTAVSARHALEWDDPVFLAGLCGGVNHSAPFSRPAGIKQFYYQIQARMELKTG